MVLVVEEEVAATGEVVEDVCWRWALASWE